MRAVWPALFSVTSLAALRVWNAPDSPDRNRALGLWAGLQGLSMLWMAWAPRDRTTQIVAAVSTAGLTAAYAHQAAYVDRKAAGLIAPTGFAGLSALIAKPAHAA
jgi:tryptophan-rich sensory protein